MKELSKKLAVCVWAAFVVDFDQGRDEVWPALQHYVQFLIKELLVETDLELACS